MKRRALSIVLPFYMNQSMLETQLKRFEGYDHKLRAELDVLVIDDGSPSSTAAPVPRFMFPEASPFKLRMWRIEKDVRWNWLAARNIGHHHAAAEWVLFTDIDHLIPEATARRLIEGKLRPENIYRFERVNYPKGDAYHPHPNSWLMTRAMFDQTGGYDERFSGHYGTDGMFRDRCAKAAETAGGKVEILSVVLERVDREIIPDASTTTYKRKAPEDREAVPRIRRAIEESGDLKPKRLTFKYHQTYGPAS